MTALTSSTANTLLTAAAVRTRASEVLELAKAEKLTHVSVNLDLLPKLAARVTRTIEHSYPDFQVPPYGCWRHFEAGGLDRWGMLASARGFAAAEDVLAAAADLAVATHVVSVSIRSDWIYLDMVAGQAFEGRRAIAIGMLAMFAAGSFSADPGDPLRVDAHALVRLEEAEIVDGLRLDPELDRVAVTSIKTILKRLGEAIGLRPDLFEQRGESRPGHLALKLFSMAEVAPVAVTDILDALLDGLSPIWQEGAKSNDVVLGDVWMHTKLFQDGPAKGLLPFHLIAQEITYALIEPFAWAGIEVAELDGLTGLGDLEHAALFLDAGIVNMKFKDAGSKSNEQSLDQATELRAVCIALFDRLADTLREQLDVSADVLPLTCILEGGTALLGDEIVRENATSAQQASRILKAGAVFWLPFGA